MLIKSAYALVDNWLPSSPSRKMLVILRAMTLFCKYFKRLLTANIIQSDKWLKETTLLIWACLNKSKVTITYIFVFFFSRLGSNKRPLKLSEATIYEIYALKNYKAVAFLCFWIERMNSFFFGVNSERIWAKGHVIRGRDSVNPFSFHYRVKITTTLKNTDIDLSRSVQKRKQTGPLQSLKNATSGNDEIIRSPD